MPTYVYKFVKTGETIEVQQSFSEPTLTKAVHPRSGRRMAVKKVFTPVGVTFKGGGFYKTDSRRSSKKSSSKSTETDKGSDSGSSSESSTSSESKTSSETKTPTTSKTSTKSD